jgi:hypothetical protein
MFSTFKQAHTRNKIVYLKTRDEYFLEYTAQKDKSDFVTHAFYPFFYYDQLIRPQLTEFNNAYLAMAILKVVLHVTITLKTFHIKDKHSNSVDNYYPRPPDLSYLWHYCYEMIQLPKFAVILIILMNIV